MPAITDGQENKSPTQSNNSESPATPQVTRFYNGRIVIRTNAKLSFIAGIHNACQ